MSKLSIKSIAHKGLELAETGRRDQEELVSYWKLIEGIENKDVSLRDSEDGEIYTKSLFSLPYMGNKSARLAIVEDVQI